MSLVSDRPRRRHAGTAARRTVVAIHELLRRHSGVALPLRLWDGSGLGDADAGFRIVLHHPWSLRAMLLPPSDLTAGEAYVEGAVDVEGDAVAASRTGARLTSAGWGRAAQLRLLRLLLRLPAPPRRLHSRRARLRGRPHSKARDRAAIAFHYDLPQAFYATFLDPQLVYSCAYFAHAGEDLETAQRRKLDVICRKLRLQPGGQLLDIGAGWGSLLLHAARNFGVRALGVTLSQTQAEAGHRRIAEAGLADRVEIRLQDYRELDGEFDAVASVGMFEHVGPANLAEYFATTYRLTRPGGLFCNHGIVLGDAERVRTGRERTFVSAYVFPDGGLVPAWRAVREFERPGFEVLDLEQLRPHYALTLRQWLRNLEAHREAAVAAASEVDFRIWRAYMAASAHSFESSSLGVVQILGVRRGSQPPDLPLTREWRLPGF